MDKWKKMYNLTYDTTGAQCAVILQNDSQPLAQFNQTMDFGQAEVLIPQIRLLLAQSEISFGELELLTVCTGPGSFTGVRAGIAAARAFGLACPQLKVSGISAFEAYAHTLDLQERAEINAVIIETKREDFYFQLFNQQLQKISAPLALEYEDIKPYLRHKKVSLAGDGVERFLSRPSGLSLHCIKMHEALPIDSLAQCGLQHYHQKSIDFPKPLYLRASDVSTPKSSGHI